MNLENKYRFLTQIRIVGSKGPHKELNNSNK